MNRLRHHNFILMFVDFLDPNYLRFLYIEVGFPHLFMLPEILVCAAHNLQRTTARELRRGIICLLWHYKWSTFGNLWVSLLWEYTGFLRWLQVAGLHPTGLPVAHHGAVILRLLFVTWSFASEFHVAKIRRRPICTWAGRLESLTPAWPLDFSSFKVLSFNSVEVGACLTAVSHLAILFVGTGSWDFFIKLKSPPAASVDSRSFRISIKC